MKKEKTVNKARVFYFGSYKKYNEMKFVHQGKPLGMYFLLPTVCLFL